MAQIFHPAFNTLAKASIFGSLFIVAAAAVAIGAFNQSDYVRGVGVAKQQPVPFSHEHHVAGLGIDCRYCHTTVETSHFAGIPPTKTCMNCHSQIWTNAQLLEPVRGSYRNNTPLQWTRVHNLPDYVYFNHSIHVNKGVGCVSCHGRVDRMPITWQAKSLQMNWCLECHREPEKFLQPRQTVFDLTWTIKDGVVDEQGNRTFPDQETLGADLVKKYKVNKPQLTNCSVCHR